MALFLRTTLYNNGVLHLELNRPQRLNAMHKAAYLEYGSELSRAGKNPDVRAIVVSGVGRAFCAGLDVVGIASDLPHRNDAEASRTAIKTTEFIEEFQEAIGIPSRLAKPVIAVAHGPTIGLAIDILSATDIRFASSDTTFSVREIDIGMAADIGTLQRLPKIVGNLGWVKDVCFTGRNFGCDEALAQGFIQRSYKTKDEAINAALSYAAELASKSPVAMLGTKRAINYSVDHSTEDGLRQIAEFNGHGLGEDFIKGAMSFKSKKKPEYGKL